ncbi:Aste57867_22794 [Aphanomyces stellatus]|uniref:Aste57867_22794 protein n=1 Tax=Aphanomyces stellatus TaxID=120398 RepID=A0A485LMV6_9STRA|nr:hypothetical protein As57867_022724 [Aphanomyces stellatus]VFT99447.1 Aste57867_22794 [Aphanomyces stellatus]
MIHDLLAFETNIRRKNLTRAGRPEKVPDSDALVAHMTKIRENKRALTFKKYHRAWLDDYLEEKRAGQEYKSLLKLLQLFSGRHGSTQQTTAKKKRRQEDLEEIRRAIASIFYVVYNGYHADTIFNVDETAMYYDMPPNKIRAVRSGSSKISSGENHSHRMTAVLVRMVR